MTSNRRRHGQLEADVVAVLWSADTALTPRTVQESLPDSAYTTVLTVLTRLHRKGLVTRVPEGRSFAYQPAETTDSSVVRRIRELLDQSDSAAVLNRFVESLDPDEERLLRQILADGAKG